MPKLAKFERDEVFLGRLQLESNSVGMIINVIVVVMSNELLRLTWSLRKTLRFCYNKEWGSARVPFDSGFAWVGPLSTTAHSAVKGRAKIRGLETL